MALTVGVVDAIRARLAAIPRKDESARDVSRLEALARMRSEILALRDGGYSWEEVAEIVSREGCRLTAATLRSELSRGASTAKSKRRSVEPAGRGAKSRGQSADPSGWGKTHVVVRGSPPRPVSPPESSPGTFVVREDSEI
jgi:hypothetical protein